jgi:hypothetical protein
MRISCANNRIELWGFEAGEVLELMDANLHRVEVCARDGVLMVRDPARANILEEWVPLIPVAPDPLLMGEVAPGVFCGLHGEGNRPACEEFVPEEGSAFCARCVHPAACHEVHARAPTKEGTL